MNYRRWFWAGVHTLGMATILVGAVACWFYPWLTVPQLAGVSWMVWFHMSHGYCPLTKKEHDAMRAAGQKPYTGGFYQYYFFKRLLRMDVDDTVVRPFTIVTKVIPGLLPATYPLIKLLIS